MKKLSYSVPVFMAVAHGKESTEGSFTNYIGVGAVNVLAVNPTKAELEKLYGRTLDKEPEYFGEQKNDADKMVKFARISFVVRTAGDSKCNNGIDMTTQVTFFLRNEAQYNRDKTKIKVIDKYGRTAWPTVEQAKQHIVPTYIGKKDGKEHEMNLDKDYRPAYVGEEELTKFIIAYLNIPSPMDWNADTRTWSYKSAEKLADSECRLDNIKQYFIGNVSELKSIISYQPNNKVKVLFGVRTNDDNRQFQAAYTNMFLTNGTQKYDRLDEDLQSRYAAGAMQSTEFKVQDLQEYEVEATDFSKKADDNDDPFAEPDSRKDESIAPNKDEDDLPFD